MTVVLAIRCDDGLVMGADTQITDSDRGMSYPARKLHLLGEHAAWGGSGARAVLGDLVDDFDDAAGTIVEAPDISRALQDRILPVLRPGRCSPTSAWSSAPSTTGWWWLSASSTR
jgi:hypothetical protein